VDASEGYMLESCRQAAEMGLGGIVVTEHADLTDWVLPEGTAISPGWEQYLDGGMLKVPALDVASSSAEDSQRRRDQRASLASGRGCRPARSWRL
jgi:hypothetical protein